MFNVRYKGDAASWPKQLLHLSPNFLGPLRVSPRSGASYFDSMADRGPPVPGHLDRTGNHH